MLINEANRSMVESILLGGSRTFQDEQINVINAIHSTNIMACPGSGKTTVLIAKIALLLQKLKDEGSTKGICIITHTNVAVEEIVKNLAKFGFNDIEYPHFVGTIHEFFNRFFSLKAYDQFTSRDRFYLMENEVYKSYFEKYFWLRKHKPLWWNNPTPFYAVDRIDVLINDQNEPELRSRKIGGGDYDDSCLAAIYDMFSNGFLRHSDTVSLANWYIRSHKELIQEAVKQRFQYFFVDEAQDTSLEQYDNLNLILDGNDETIVQWYGDSYQALYSLYGKEDAWLPTLEESEQINYSNRFGEKIARILRTTCIEEYSRLSVNEGMRSADPHLFLYNDESKVNLFNVYAQVVAAFKNSSFETQQATGKMTAVCKHHDSLEGYSSAYDRSKVKKPLQTDLQASFEICHRSLLEGLKANDIGTNKERKEYVRNISQYLTNKLPVEYAILKAAWAEWFKLIKDQKENTPIVKQLRTLYRKLFIAILNKDVNDEIDISCVEVLHSQLLRVFHGDVLFTELNPETDDFPVELNTVHGVKGETHFSTLLLESLDRNGRSDLQSIFGFLTGTHNSALTQDSFIKDNLKLAYVALSRPRYFAGIAIHKNNLSEENIEDAVRHGWTIVDVDSYT
ncbi:UvrD-helicase domain-containing protein [Paenibacillus sp. NRS-1783]|uniref:UvrD-helicase domain-containing protein n=1 Tax=Paenibacillus sp. NRS-1783 TaxID=3233907 RepID=UPI003D2E620C